jgi:mono/diheme cytochrome c family protein
MNAISNSLLGIAFLGVGAAATFLMYHLWGYPYDKEKLYSFAPRGLIRLHRLLGYVYLILYVYFLVQMVPRLWNYQIEFPARTVVHITLGMVIGVILVIKLAIVRFFRHMEARMLPFLGTSLLICTALLIALSAPFAMRERYLRAAALSGNSLDPVNLERVRTLLSQAGFTEKDERERLTSPDGLERGQAVLTRKCVVCHDLRTVLVRPRTPDNWRAIVQRMAERSAQFDTITEVEQSQVTAYLIAIAPQLQRATRAKRTQSESADKSAQALQRAGALLAKIGATSSLADAKRIFQSKCSQCHDLKQIDDSPPKTDQQVRNLVSRMVGEGLSGTPEELAAIIWYLGTKYVR